MIFGLEIKHFEMLPCRYHTKAIRCVAYHKQLPLFASCSDDGSIQIFHGMVYNDLLQNPLIVPVKVLKGRHEIVNNLGKYCTEHMVRMNPHGEGLS